MYCMYWRVISAIGMSEWRFGADQISSRSTDPQRFEKLRAPAVECIDRAAARQRLTVTTGISACSGGGTMSGSAAA
jgi:hypothetical protein